jgi:signal transduction histidine kinase
LVEQQNNARAAGPIDEQINSQRKFSVISLPAPTKFGHASFRTKLLLAMMLVVSAITILGVYFTNRQLAANAEQALKRQFQSEIASLHNAREVRHAALAELCRNLADKPRIHAALEDNAIELLYPTAKDELRDMMAEDEPKTARSAVGPFHAIFYRFLDGKGVVILPPNPGDAGELDQLEESQITLPALPGERQIGYLARNGNGPETIEEIIAMPIISTETNEPIAAIVVGFKPIELTGQSPVSGIKRGIWLKGRLHLPSPANSSETFFGNEVAEAMEHPGRAEQSFTVNLNGAAHLLFYKQLNPNSLFPPAYEICIYPLTDLVARQRRLRWQISGVGALLLLAAFSASHLASTRLSKPVEKLEIDSAVNRVQRERAEAALEKTSKELQRSARFSADTSHQLKTPVTVLRAGLEELRARRDVSGETREEISALIHQTYRITSIIEDLLLLSQMDAGRLQISFNPVDLNHLIEAQIDDLSALPDGADLKVESECAAAYVAGDQHYIALILQNLLENARKYNRPRGLIRISCHQDAEWAFLTVGNTGGAIPKAAQEHIFERFHRGLAGENVTGHGLGLDLARELARLHGGDVRLIRSDNDWTEFEVRFRLVRQPSVVTAQVG